MPAHAVFQVQELCDNIVGLVDSPTDLKAFALVSSKFAASAQRNLFHEIILTRTCFSFEGSIAGLASTADEAAACRQFISVITATPHLLPMVHRLRVSMFRDVVEPLSKVQFPNLQVLMLQDEPLRFPNTKTSEAAGKIVSLPSIRRVELRSLRFRYMRDLGRMFEHCTSRLDSVVIYRIRVYDEAHPHSLSAPVRRAAVKDLWLSEDCGYERGQWILDPLCPFDFSALTAVDLTRAIGIQFTPTLLARSRLTITRLKLNSHQAVHINPTFSHLIDIARFPAVSHLTLVAHNLLPTTADDIADVEALLAQLLPAHRLEFLGVDLLTAGDLDLASLRRLGIALASKPLPALRRMKITVHRVRFSVADPVTWSQVQSAFAEIDARRQLEVVSH
ncbi:hypothetical protein DFH09DRAFT_1379389 [Mycena vulgaris]|nr:hypothetical protein DFH09DRAFT_1379389 [Mycena vulgaris]